MEAEPSTVAQERKPPLETLHIGESFNIYQGTLAMVSIFLGFVFAGILQVLASSEPLTPVSEWVIGVLVCAMMLLYCATAAFHITTVQVVRCFGIMFPQSRIQFLGAAAITIGMCLMFVAVGLLLLVQGLNALAYFVFLFSLVPFAVSEYMRRLRKGFTIVDVGDPTPYGARAPFHCPSAEQVAPPTPGQRDQVAAASPRPKRGNKPK